MIANPWGKSITLANANQAYNLWTLLQGVDAALKLSNCCMVQIQSSVVNAGAILYIGNGDVSTINRGVEVFASQAFGIESVEQNFVDLNQIYLLTDTPGLVVNVEFMVR